MKQFFNRTIRVVQLDTSVYLEIKEDPSALGSAVVLLILSSIATGVGSVEGYVEKIPMAILTACAAWVIWVLFIYLLGARLFPQANTQTNLSAVIRVIGFASAPGILKLLAFFPAFSGITLFGATIWLLAATTVAAQAVLHYPNLKRAFAISFFGWILYQWLLFQI